MRRATSKDDIDAARVVVALAAVVELGTGGADQQIIDAVTVDVARRQARSHVLSRAFVNPKTAWITLLSPITDIVAVKAAAAGVDRIKIDGQS